MRAAIVVGLLLAFASPAHAIRAQYPPRCQHVDSIVLAEHTSANAELAAPQLYGIEIQLRYQPLETMPVASLFAGLVADEHTEYVEIAVYAGAHDTTPIAGRVITTPLRTSICDPDNMRLAPGPHLVKVWPRDRVGNRGAVAQRVVTVADPTEKNPQGHVKSGSGMALILFGPVLLAALLLGILLVISLRHWRTQHEVGEAVSPLVADHIGKAVLRRATSASVAAAVGFVTSLFLSNPLLSLLIAMIASVPLSSMIAARRVIRELGNDRARAELRETVLIVRSPDGQARLATSHRVIERARANAVPAGYAALRRDV